MTTSLATLMRFRTTAMLFISLVLGFGAQLLFAPSTPGPMPDLRIGAITRWLVAEGEVFRIGTMVLVHGGWWHFLPNLYMVTLLSWVIESRFGSARTAAIALGGGLASGVVLSFTAEVPTMGSSGIICGLLAGGAVLLVGAVPRGWPPLGVVATGMTVEFLFPSISDLLLPTGNEASVEGHLAGCVGGMTVAGVFRATRPSESAIRRLALVGLAIFVLLWTWGAIVLTTWNDRALLDAAGRVYDEPDANATAVLLLAWEALTSQEASAKDRARALAAVESALERDPTLDDLHAVNGLLREREGDHDASIRELHISFSLQPSRLWAELLAEREAHHVSSSPAIAGIRTVRSENEGTEAWTLAVDTTVDRGCEWHVLGLEGDRPHAYLWLRLGSHSSKPVGIDFAESQALPDVRWVATYQRCDDVPPDARNAQYWELHRAPG